MILRRVGKISKMERSHKTVHRKGGKVERKIGSLGGRETKPPSFRELGKQQRNGQN